MRDRSRVSIGVALNTPGVPRAPARRAKKVRRACILGRLKRRFL
jgi:hypothetical protein